VSLALEAPFTLLKNQLIGILELVEIALRAIPGTSGIREDILRDTGKIARTRLIAPDVNPEAELLRFRNEKDEAIKKINASVVDTIRQDTDTPAPEFIDVAADRRKQRIQDTSFPGQFTPKPFSGGFPSQLQEGDTGLGSSQMATSLTDAANEIRLWRQAIEQGRDLRTLKLDQGLEGGPRLVPRTEVNVNVNIDGKQVAAQVTKKITSTGFQPGQGLTTPGSGLVTPRGGRFFDKQLEDTARTVAR